MAVEKIVVGRDISDIKSFKERGTAFIGKHIVGKGEEARLTNPIQMDVTRPHVVLVTGKRGSGKSYTAAVVTEEMLMLPMDVKENLSVVMIDTMGIFWSMSKPNERDRELLKEWGFKPRGFDISLFVPKGFVEEYKSLGISCTPLTLPAGELTATDWLLTFEFSILDPHGIVLERAVKELTETKGDSYSIDEIIAEVESDKRTEKKVKDVVINRLLAAKDWGIFERKGTHMDEIFRPGTVTVIDVSHYMRSAGVWSVRGMLVGMLSRKIFQQRLTARKAEEVETMTGEVAKKTPMVWIVIDEAHNFVPSKVETAASEPLLTLVKEGREPGISLLLITQRPNKLHADALAQSDLILSHRLTSKADIEALRSIMQTYVLEDIQELINSLPRQKGAAVILDDNSERLYAVQVRPRLSWHAGGSPIAIKEEGLFGEKA